MLSLILKLVIRFGYDLPLISKGLIFLFLFLTMSFFMKLLNIYLNYRFQRHRWIKNPREDLYWTNVGFSLNLDFSKILINPKAVQDDQVCLAHYLSKTHPHFNEKVIENLISHNSWPNLGETRRDALWSSLLLSKPPLLVNNVKKFVDHLVDTHMDLTGLRVLRKLFPIWMREESFENMIKVLSYTKEIYINPHASPSSRDEYVNEWIDMAFKQSLKEQKIDHHKLQQQVIHYVNFLSSLDKVDSCDLIRAWFKVKNMTDKDPQTLSLEQKIILNGIVQVFQIENEETYAVDKNFLNIDLFMSKEDEKLYQDKNYLSPKDVVEMDLYLSQCKSEMIFKEELLINLPTSSAPIIKVKRL